MDRTVQAKRTPYHHGNLHAALVEAAVALAREGGPDAVVLREVSRRAGVSHNAGYRHFADRDALLGEVCGVGMSALARAMEAEIAKVRGGRDAREVAWRRLTATGRAYVHFALAEPGLFRTAFSVPESTDHSVEGSKGLGDSGLNPYSLLNRCLDELVGTGAIAPARRPLAELVAWSAVHGYAVLMLDGPLRALPDATRDKGLRKLLGSIRGGI